MYHTYQFDRQGADLKDSSIVNFYVTLYLSTVGILLIQKPETYKPLKDIFCSTFKTHKPLSKSHFKKKVQHENANFQSKCLGGF